MVLDEIEMRGNAVALNLPAIRTIRENLLDKISKTDLKDEADNDPKYLFSEKGGQKSSEINWRRKLYNEFRLVEKVVLKFCS